MNYEIGETVILIDKRDCYDNFILRENDSNLKIIRKIVEYDNEDESYCTEDCNGRMWWVMSNQITKISRLIKILYGLEGKVK